MSSETENKSDAIIGFSDHRSEMTPAMNAIAEANSQALSAITKKASDSRSQIRTEEKCS